MPILGMFVYGDLDEALNRPREDGQETPRKRRKTDHGPLRITESMWTQFEKKVDKFGVQHVLGKSKFAFDFVEGPLVNAVRSGDWYATIPPSNSLANIRELGCCLTRSI